MLSDEMMRRQGMCMGGPCHWEMLPDAHSLEPEIHVKSDGFVHRYERMIINMGGDRIIRYYYRSSRPDVDPTGETGVDMGAAQ